MFAIVWSGVWYSPGEGVRLSGSAAGASRPAVPATSIDKRTTVQSWELAIVRLIPQFKGLEGVSQRHLEARKSREK
jgi:hypothetical protein